MKISFDWKFWLVLIASIASIVGPLWLWRFDLQSRALSVTSISSIPLTPASPHITSDLQVSLAGRTLETPYSTIIEISNTGSKPILAAEIEGTIDLQVSAKSKIIQAQIIKKQPNSLLPTLTITAQTASLQPLLLNPGDQITVAILTESGKPMLLPRARIAGVPEIELIENSVRKSFLKNPWLIGLASFLSILGIMMLMIMHLFPQRTFPLVLPMASTFATVIIATLTAAPIWRDYFPDSALLFTVTLVCPAVLIVWLISLSPKLSIRQ